MTQDGWEVRGDAIDPKEFGPGTGLRLRALSFQLPTQNGAWIDMSDWGGAILSLSSLVDDNIEALGTAFIVGPGIALTATHVLTDYEDRGRLRGALALLGARLGKAMIWNVTHAEVPYVGDVSVLFIEPRFEHEWPLEIEYLKLTARAPLAGERVATAGLRATQDKFDREQGVAVTGFVSSGTVTDFYGERRDWAPHVATTLTTIGGMSGGPVFDRHGNVCGVVTSSIELMDSPGEFITMVTLLWGALLFKISPDWPRTFYPRQFRLWSLAEHRHRLMQLEDGEVAYAWGDEHLGQ